MKNWIATARVAALLLVGLLAVNPAAFAQGGNPKITHDS